MRYNLRDDRLPSMDELMGNVSPLRRVANAAYNLVDMLVVRPIYNLIDPPVSESMSLLDACLERVCARTGLDYYLVDLPGTVLGYLPNKSDRADVEVLYLFAAGILTMSTFFDGSISSDLSGLGACCVGIGLLYHRQQANNASLDISNTSG